MIRFFIKPNQELEGWDIIERNGIQTEEGNEDSVLATFYEHSKAIGYVHMLNYIA